MLPKWFLAVLVLAIVNSLAVVGSILGRHLFAADEQDEGKSSVVAVGEVATPVDRASVKNLVDAVVEGTATPDPTDSTALPGTSGIPGLEGMDVPTEVPENAMQLDPNDPGFKEFQRQAAEVYPDLMVAPSLDAVVGEKLGDENAFEIESLEHQSQEYFEALELRLEAVESINNAMLRLTQEAAQHNRSGEVAKCRHLLKITTELRELAAKLLVDEI